MKGARLIMPLRDREANCIIPAQGLPAGRPCAVNPDFRLRTTAKAYQWPLIELG